LKGIARIARVGVVIAIVASVVLAFAVLSTPGMVNTNSGNSTTKSAPSSTSVGNGGGGPFSPAILQAHIQKLNNRDVSGVVSDFDTNVVVMWTGISQGLGGTYHGVSETRFLYSTAIGGATKLNYVIQKLNTTTPSPGIANVVAELAFNGTSNILGKFNGTVAAAYTYANSGGNWVISKENWNYKAFNVEYSQGATTFPQWQITGPTLPDRYSESPFKNWVYFYGGLGVAIILAGYLVSLPLIAYVQKRKQK
jgi:hypothetical protein